MLTGCSAKYLKPSVSLPEDPSYGEVNIFPCEAISGHSKARFIFNAQDSYGHYTAFCMSEEDLRTLLQNLVKINKYNEELKELLKGVANVKEPTSGD